MTYVSPTPTPPTPQQMLAEAMAALHALKIGRLSTEIEVDGRRVRYARTDIDKLQGYVDYLNAQIAGNGPCIGGIGFYL